MGFGRKFFARDAESVARELLGKVLVRRWEDGREVRGVITEAEAYVGVEDLASHAAGGRKTKRTEVMFGPAGHVYMFFTYGVHWMLNIVCGEEGDPQAVLIRGIGTLKNINGPGRVTKFLELDGSFYGEDLTTSNRLWVEPPSLKATASRGKILVTSRIGVEYAKEWAAKPLRFLLR